LITGISFHPREEEVRNRMRPLIVSGGNAKTTIVRSAIHLRMKGITHRHTIQVIVSMRNFDFRPLNHPGLRVDENLFVTMRIPSDS
jgi:hypothetical protein